MDIYEEGYGEASGGRQDTRHERDEEGQAGMCSNIYVAVYRLYLYIYMCVYLYL